MWRRLIYSFLVVVVTAIPVAAQTGKWRQLYNGKDMTGWQHVGPGEFVIDKGLLKGVGGMGLLWYTGRKFGNCEFRLVFHGENYDSNSGFYIRIPEKPTEPGMPVKLAHEIQIADGDTGEIFGLTKAKVKAATPGAGWNTMEVTLDGPRTIVKLNGQLVTDYTEGTAKPFISWIGPEIRPNEGYIGVQNHPPTGAYFKEIAWRPLHEK